MNLLCWKMAPNTRITRKWEMFAGRNKFYCDGHLMTAPNSSVFYLTCFLITGTSALFFAFDCPFLAIRISPAIPVIGSLLYLFTISSLLRTSFSDPGVIPRANLDEAAYIEKQIEVPNSLNSPTYRPPPRTKEVLVRGQTVKLKYCFTCKIFRPPRASHCSLCDNCVDKFDHHCPWVGNCVGKRNYRFFYMFIVSLAFLAVFIFSCALTHIVLLMKDNEEFIEVVKKTPFSVIITIICFFSIWSVIGLAGFHTYLTASDQTTNEDIKGSFSTKSGQQAINPYSQGNLCLNCFHILCGPTTPSLIDRRGIVTDEYRIQMQQTETTTNYFNGTSGPPIIAQPVNSDTSTRVKLFENNIDQNISNSGVYRQRSYDNLQNGKSTNSVDRLVENEIPLSTIQIPSEEIAIEDDNIENLSNRNNLLISGSYNNLFCDKFDNDDEDDDDDDNNRNDNDSNKIKNGQSENVYSNIPPIIKSVNEITLDPSLHVYSNVIGEPTVKTISKNSINFNISSIEDPNDTILTTSTFINDDLDLDDPVIITSAFGNSNNHTIDVKDKKNHSTPPLVSSKIKNNSNKKVITAIIEMKSVIPNVTIREPNNSISSCAGVNTSSNNSYISPNKIKHYKILQDTTMIDTALDLDSLDGSSIGNNSQACLVKTAIV